VASVLAQQTSRQLREKAAAKELLDIITRNLWSTRDEAEAGHGHHLLVTAR
jgi:hypothetical protein